MSGDDDDAVDNTVKLAAEQLLLLLLGVVGGKHQRIISTGDGDLLCPLDDGRIVFVDNIGHDDDDELGGAGLHGRCQIIFDVA